MLINPSYLSNPIVQENLDAMIHKGTQHLFIAVDYLTELSDPSSICHYQIELAKNISGKYQIIHEQLSYKSASSRSSSASIIYEVSNGSPDFVKKRPLPLQNNFLGKATNLLDVTSMCALFYKKVSHLFLHKKRKNLMSSFYI